MELSGDLSGRLRCKNYQPYLLTTRLRCFADWFRGRDDVWALRWESKNSGKSGYSPACANEWQPGICGKPRIKCSDCSHRQLIPVSDPVIYRHLAGEHTIGVYPLLEDDFCYFLAVDFDEAEWQADASAVHAIL